MAFRFGDPGGRLYNTGGTGNANIFSLWTGSNSNATSANINVQTSGGRTTGSSLRKGIGAGGQSSYISVTLGSQATWGWAAAIRFNTAFPTNAFSIFNLVDATTLQCDLRILPDGTLQVTRSNTVLGTTSIALALNVYAHVEWLTTINSSTGTTQVWINGISALNLSGQNTRASTNNSASVLALGNFFSQVGGTGTSMDYDDVIIYDGQTTDPQGNPDICGQIGDCGLVWLLPSGAGTTTQFTPDTGSNFARVNEVAPDGDTSYVADSTIGHIDTYAIANLPSNIVAVKSLAVVGYARKDDVGNRSFAPEIRTNSANFNGFGQPLGNNYQYFFNSWGQNPSGTPANWTTSDVNAIEAGQKVIA